MDKALSGELSCPCDRSCLNFTFKVNTFIAHFQVTQILGTKYLVICKVYTGYCATSMIEHGLSTCTVSNPLTKTCGLSLSTGGQSDIFFCH